MRSETNGAGRRSGKGRTVKSLVLIAGAAGLAFAGGYGAGRYETARQASAAAAQSAPSGGAGAAASRADAFYVEAGQLVVPMLAKGRTIAFILTQITLETDSSDEANLVRRRLPHARSAMLEALFGLAGTGRFDGPAVDPAAVSAELLRSVRDPGVTPAVRAVLIDRLLRQDNSRL